MSEPAQAVALDVETFARMLALLTRAATLLARTSTPAHRELAAEIRALLSRGFGSA